MLPSTSGFGLSDSPFTSGGYSSFDELSRSVAANTSSASSAGGGSGSKSGSSGGGFFDGFLGTLGNAVERVADFGTQLFIYDELAERGQTSATNNTVTNTTANPTATGTVTSSSLIKGVPNEMLFIGLGVVVVLLLLMKVK